MNRLQMKDLYKEKVVLEDEIADLNRFKSLMNFANYKKRNDELTASLYEINKELEGDKENDNIRTHAERI